MKVWFLALALQAAQPAAPQTPPAESAPKAPQVEPYAGTLRAGRLELAQLSKLEKHDQVANLSLALLAKPDWELASETERAETLYALGVGAGRAGDIPAAVESFQRARGLAGSTELGLASAFNAGTYLLIGAEELRRQIPEIREQLGLPPLSQAPAAPAGPGAAAQAPDALQIAREAYLRARSELADAWRAAPAEADTRANLELAVKRLRELDALEKQREEQQQEQQQDQQQDPNSQQDPQEKPPESQDKQDKQDQQQPQDSQPKEGEQSEQQPDEQPQPKEDQQDESKQDPQQAQPNAEQEELQLSPEEMARLLDQLQKIEEQARQVEALLRERRRTPVKKDW